MKRKFLKEKYLDYIIVFCAFIFVSAFPSNLIFKNELYAFILSLILWVLLIAGLTLYLIKKLKFKLSSAGFFSKIACFLPYFLLIFINLIYLKNYLNEAITFSYNQFDLSILIFRVIAEELVFRIIFNDIFKFKNIIFGILISSLFFSMTHILNLFSNSADLVLFQCVYTFLIGLVLDFIYVYGRSISLIILFHFGFNLLNQELFDFNLINFTDSQYLIFIVSLCFFYFVYTLNLIYLKKKNLISFK